MAGTHQGSQSIVIMAAGTETHEGLTEEYYGWNTRSHGVLTHNVWLEHRIS
jgi:hypothetical protein